MTTDSRHWRIGADALLEYVQIEPRHRQQCAVRRTADGRPGEPVGLDFPEVLMINDHNPRDGFSAVSRALLAATAELAEEFPSVGLPTLYDLVGQARLVAAVRLPDVTAYGLAIRAETRRLITGEPTVVTLPDVEPSGRATKN